MHAFLTAAPVILRRLQLLPRLVSWLLAPVARSAPVVVLSSRFQSVFKGFKGLSSRIGCLEMFSLTTTADISWPLSYAARMRICSAVFSHVISSFPVCVTVCASYCILVNSNKMSLELPVPLHGRCQSHFGSTCCATDCAGGTAAASAPRSPARL